MKICDIIQERSLGDVSQLLDDVKDRLSTLSTADVTPFEQLNQIKVVFKLYENDPRKCIIYLEILPDRDRASTDLKFKKKIISAAASRIFNKFSQRRLPDYSNAKIILSTKSIGPRAISTLTNAKYWKIVSVTFGDITW